MDGEQAPQPEDDELLQKARLEFRNYYRDNNSLLLSAQEAFENLVALLLRDADFPAPKVVLRLKDCVECLRNFDLKYRHEAQTAAFAHAIQNYITDLIGVRVICLYEDDVPKVRDIINAALNIVNETDKTGELEKDHRTFGYKGLHLDVKLDAIRSDLPEYRQFSTLQFEVQIRSIVQDAWSEVDHKLKYKRNIPKDLQRRISRLAALFELADQEFRLIRDFTVELEEKAKSPTEPSDNLQRALDVFGFIRVVEPLFLGYRFEPYKVDGFVDEIMQNKPDTTIVWFNSMMQKHIDRVREYNTYMNRIGNNLNPYTMTRHILYLSDPHTFVQMILPGPRQNFDRWIKHGTVFPSEV